MTRKRALAFTALAALTIGACEDDFVTDVGPRGSEAFERYVSMGTSVSMGTQSDGVVYFTQQYSWPAQLARLAFAQGRFRQPLISTTITGQSGTVIYGGGCSSPLIGPLQFGRRYSSASAAFGGFPADTGCSPLQPGVTLPTNNVAVDGFRAYDALRITPESALVVNPAAGIFTPVGSARGSGKVVGRVLPPNTTQVRAMMAQRPTLVSIEFGANELLSVYTGVLNPSTTGRGGQATTIVPVAVFKQSYDAIADSVRKTGARAVIAGLGFTNIADFPSLRSGTELAAAAAQLQAFGVIVAADCGTTNANNLLFVPTRIFGAIATAQGTGQPQTLTCANNPNATPAGPDFVLTPADVAIINATLAEYNTYTKGVADANGWAYFTLGEAIYNTAKVPLNIPSLLQSAMPFGPVISLDGVHPNNTGHTRIAAAAAAALNAKYGFQLGTIPNVASTP